MAQKSSYLNQEILIPQVDEQDRYIGPVERWKAHREGILHRAFTVAVYYDGKIICQHRKHPVFNDVFDFTASSHPQVLSGVIQSVEDAVYATLDREWGMKKTDVQYLNNVGFALYDDKDPNSEYREHEYCYLLTCETTHLPILNSEVAYGYSLVSNEELNDPVKRALYQFAPWVHAFLAKGLLTR